MAKPTAFPFWAAVLGRLGDTVADPRQQTVLMERLVRHGADLQGQVPELLLRSPDPQASLNDWLATRDLSHWWPQAWGGTASDGWQFEKASLNRARGAEAMDTSEIAMAHLDGGLDALLAEGVPAWIALEAGEAAVIAVMLQLTWLMIRSHRTAEGSAGADPLGKVHPALQAIVAVGLQGASFSLLVSMCLALVPGGQLWLPMLAVLGIGRSLPMSPDDPFQIQKRGH